MTFKEARESESCRVIAGSRRCFNGFPCGIFLGDDNFIEIFGDDKYDDNFRDPLFSLLRLLI